jgi:hypothetical protein
MLQVAKHFGGDHRGMLAVASGKILLILQLAKHFDNS